MSLFCFSSRRRHTRCALVTGVQTCALPICAKQLHIGVIPRAVDDYLQFRGNYPAQDLDKKLGNPVHHIHNGQVPEAALPVTYGLLLNLVGVMGAEATEEQVWAYLGNYVEDARADKYPELAGFIRNALAYNRDFIAPTLLQIGRAHD